VYENSAQNAALVSQLGVLDNTSLTVDRCVRAMCVRALTFCVRVQRPPDCTHRHTTRLALISAVPGKRRAGSLCAHLTHARTWQSDVVLRVAFDVSGNASLVLPGAPQPNDVRDPTSCGDVVRA
jgi:hypothetical protein